MGLPGALVAANVPGSVEVRVMALVNPSPTSIVFGNLLSRAVGSQVAADEGRSARGPGRRRPGQQARGSYSIVKIANHLPANSDDPRASLAGQHYLSSRELGS